MGDSGERKWIRPDLPSKCTYEMNKTSESDSPHRHLKRYVQDEARLFFIYSITFHFQVLRSEKIKIKIELRSKLCNSRQVANHFFFFFGKVLGTRKVDSFFQL